VSALGVSIFPACDPFDGHADIRVKSTQSCRFTEYLRSLDLMKESVRIGQRGTIVLPAAVRRSYGLEEGATVLLEERDDGILIRPAVVLPVEVYTPTRKAAFLLSGAMDADDYAVACDEVRRMGFDPEKIPHSKPSGV
jgi:AbrB family looped-hinge helix DNA binding protein